MIYDSMAFRVQVLRRASPLLVGLLAFRELGSEVSPVGLIRVWNFGFRDSGFRCGIKLWSGVIPRRSLINRIPVHKNRCNPSELSWPRHLSPATLQTLEPEFLKPKPCTARTSTRRWDALNAGFKIVMISDCRFAGMGV